MKPRLAYAALAAAVAGPLLRPGLILAVDLPLVPHPRLGSSYWGVASGTHAGPPNRLPIDLLFVGLGHLGLVAVGEKLLLLAIVFLAGLGMHRAVPAERELGRYFAGILYAVNPFVYGRLVTGQWYLLLGYALLPWAFAQLVPLARGEWRRAWRFAAVATAVGIADPHMLALLAVLVVTVTAASLVRTSNRRRSLGAVALGSALTVLASVYWLLPTPGLRELWAHVGAAQLRLYSTVGDPTWGVGGAVAALGGYWNDADPISAHLRAWPMLAAALVVLAAWGIAVARREPVTWALAASGLAGFLLALGTRGGLTGDAFRALLAHVAAARSFREPQKGAALLALAYAYLGGIGVGELRAHARAAWQPLAAAPLAAALLALPLLAGYRELGELSGDLGTSAYPRSWSQARTLLDAEAADSRTLVLPWHGYYALGFAGHRVVADTMAGFLGTPTLASRSVGEGAAADDSSDPVDAAVTGLLARGSTRSDLGACLAPLGVSHVLVAKQADWQRYGFLARQRDLVVERRWGDLVLYRNLHPTSLATRVAHLGRGLCDTRVAPVAASSPDPAHLVLSQPAPPGSLLALAPAGSGGWTLGGGPARRHGALELVRSDGRARTLELGSWPALRRNYLLGLGALLLALASALLLRLRPAAARRAASPAATERRRLWIVLPTYNEAENIRPMVAALQATLIAHGLDGSILVVDDDSPDGTGALADALAGKQGNVHVLHRTAKEGLGRAYVDGFRVALAAGADVAIGSRYVGGGGVVNWGLGRRALSRLGCLYARTVLDVPVRDLTGGFKCFRADALARLGLETVRADGYGFQIETTYRATRLGLDVVELPIVFRDRTAGRSKMSRRIALEALVLVPRLRLAQAAAAFGLRPRRSSSTVAASRSAQATESALAD